MSGVDFVLDLEVGHPAPDRPEQLVRGEADGGHVVGPEGLNGG